ncbi:MAG: hypothetical protein ABEJ28_02665 [Salinigranum sp.]
MSEERTYDELAGVVDLFGALTRSELERALEELAFKRGRSADGEALAGAVDGAVERYYLVTYRSGSDGGEPTESNAEVDPVGDESGAELVTPGPVAFPTLPPNAEDLPHILDVESRTIDRRALGTQVCERLRGDAARAVAADDRDRVERLIDVSYDLEAWAPVDVAPERERLASALDGLDG